MKAKIWITLFTSLILFTTCAGPASSVEKNQPASPRTGSDQEGAADLEGCRISTMEASFWRDWMPIVEHPGPDGGSPLRARIKIWVDNSAGDAKRISWRAVLTDGKDRYPLSLHVLPNFRVVPEKVRGSLGSLDEEAKKEIIKKYNVLWDGTLKKGESREVAFASAEGPYLPEGSRLHLEMSFTDQRGRSILLKSSGVTIGRTD